jgi:ABC-type transport system involved in cytochrome c biogenesis permease subunit
MTNLQLGQLSNDAVATAIAVLGLAVVAYAVSAARARARMPALSTDRGPSTSAAVGAVARQGTVARGLPTIVRDGPGRTADVLVRVGTILLVLALLSRGLAVGRVPWGNMYEFTLAGAVAASVALVFGLRNATIRPLAAWAVMIVLLALGLAVTVLWTPAGELVPVLDSYWLVIHVAAAITAGGIFTLGFVIAVAYLIRTRHGRVAAVDLNRVSYTLHLVAFPVWTFAVMAGAIWAENAWGRYWGWDPKETWAFITWVAYAAYLHAQATPRWRGRRAALLAVLGYSAFLFNFFGVNLWIPGLHSYAGI